MIKLPDFIIIPYQLMEDKRITLIDERLYGIIYWLTKLKNEQCTASNKTLAELVKAQAGTIRNSLTKLEELGYLKRIFKDEKRKIRKEIIVLVVFSKVSPTNDTQQKVSSTNDTVSSTNDTRCHPQMHRRRKDNKKSKEYLSTRKRVPRVAPLRAEGETPIPEYQANEISKLIENFAIVNPSYQRLYTRLAERKALERMVLTHGLKKISDVIKILPSFNASKYNAPIIKPVELENGLGRIKAWGDKQRSEVPRVAEIKNE